MVSELFTVFLNITFFNSLTNQQNIGASTLEVISASNNFNYWMYKTIAKYINPNDKVLEIGSGIANISQYFVDDGFDITFSDLEQTYVDRINEKYSNKFPVFQLDLVNENFEQDYSALLGGFDVVYSLNVIEHIEDDALAIKNLAKLIKPNGTVINLVPAYRFLFNSFDLGLEHKRRYTKKSLRELYLNSGIETKNDFYFNAFGVIGWFVFGNVLKRKQIPEGKMSIYNRIIPFFKFLDFLLFKSLGLSVVSIGEIRILGKEQQ